MKRFLPHRASLVGTSFTRAMDAVRSNAAVLLALSLLAAGCGGSSGGDSPAPPSGLTYATNPATYTKGTAIAANSPSSTGGAVVSYAVSPALPTGLALNTTTGVISGTPTVVAAQATHVVTATNSGGSTTANLAVRVNDVAPSALAYALNPATYERGIAIAANAPSSSGGTVVSYAVNPALPAGLALNTTTGVVSGTPTAIAAQATYVVTATNSGGSATANLVVTVKEVVPADRFAYVAMYRSNVVQAYGLDGITGALRAIGSPVPAGEGPVALAVHPTGRYVYAAALTSGGIRAFSIDGTSGALTEINQYAAGAAPLSLAIDPQGTFLYVSNSGSGTLTGYAIDGSGALSEIAGSPFAAGTSPHGLIVDPAGLHAYVANYDSDSISTFLIDRTTGLLTRVGSDVAAGTHPYSVTLHPSGKFAYVPNFDSGNVSAYAIDASTGALTTVAGSPFATGHRSPYAAVDPTGKFAYVSNSGDLGYTISAYGINGTTGALTALSGSPFATAAEPTSLVVDASGKFLHVTNTTGDAISTYAIDAVTGNLTPASTVSTDLAFPRAIVTTAAQGASTVQVTLNTSEATMDPGTARVFTAVVTGATLKSVTWATSPVGAGVLTVLDASSVAYTSPASAGQVLLTATAVADVTASATATLTVRATPAPTQDIFNNWNIGGVSNGPTSPTTFTIAVPRHVVYFDTYHYFNGGVLPGLLSLRHSDGTVYGPWQTTGGVGQGGVQNALWICYPDMEIKAGTYTVVDSNAGTWSYNAESGGAGFAHLTALTLP